ncbi:MAG: LysM peptidoglycan-binding domain-containing protein [bacterium]|nr:LysM peptidoglycan-binding domain-containing protein [bacterium]
MQQIERYGVIALLLLLVTIVVVALWDGGDPARADGDKKQEVAQVDQDKTKQSARKTSNRQQPPTRGTRTQAQNRARADQRAGLNRGTASRNAMEYRSRLISPNGVPSNTKAQSLRPRNQVDRKQPVRRAPTPRDTTTKKNTLDKPAFRAELPRGRDKNQYGGGSKALGNITNLASDPTPAVRDLRKKAKRKPVKGPMYLIKPGDSLQLIARHTLGDAGRWEEIQQLNGMRDTVVIAGRKLRLPVGANPDRTSFADAKKKARGVTEAASRVAAGSGYYAVKSGDSLSQIAQDELGSMNYQDDIIALNPGLTPENLRAGSEIRMPVRGKSIAKNSPKNSPKKRSKPKADSRYVVH